MRPDTPARPLLLAALTIVVIALPRLSAAQDVGLLLGVAERGDHHALPERHSTIWMVYDGGRVRETRRLAGLVVPGSAGFRRVWIDRACEPQSDDGDEPKIHCGDTLRVRAATRVVPRRAMSAESACTTYQLSITFASPAILSVSNYSWLSDCAQRSWSDIYAATVRGYSSAEPIAFASLGPGAREAYESAAREARNVGVPEDEPPPQSETCYTDPEAGTAWAVTRDRDRWVAELYQQQGSELCTLRARIAWTLPANVLGYPEPPVDWTAITRVLPEAEEAYVAPGGGLAVVVLPAAVRVYPLAGGIPDQPLFELARAPYPETHVVMVQWATGRSTARWSRMLAGLR